MEQTIIFIQRLQISFLYRDKYTSDWKTSNHKGTNQSSPKLKKKRGIPEQLHMVATLPRAHVQHIRTSIREHTRSTWIVTRSKILTSAEPVSNALIYLIPFSQGMHIDFFVLSVSTYSLLAPRILPREIEHPKRNSRNGASRFLLLNCERS